MNQPLNEEENELRLRPANFADAPGIVSLIRRAYALVGERLGFSDERFANYPGNYDARRYAVDIALGRRYVVVQSAQSIIATIAMRVADNRTGEISRLAVDPAHQRSGLGGELLIYAIAWARHLHLARIELTIAAPETALRQWLERYGFRTRETRELAGVPVAVSFMTRLLASTTVRQSLQAKAQAMAKV